jgi:hypothetical protein
MTSLFALMKANSWPAISYLFFQTQSIVSLACGVLIYRLMESRHDRVNPVLTFQRQ